mgnify:CR=1 FL=1
MKSQQVRLIDVFAIGPGLIYAASKNRLTKIEKNFLLVTGIATILYNLKNYIELRGSKNAN